MLQTSLFMAPERVICGQGVALQAGVHAKDLGARKAFIITDEIIAGLPVFKEIVQSIEDQGIDSYVYSDVDVNPSDVQVEKGAALYHSEKADILVAVGGGSPLDSAKAIGILATNGGTIHEYDNVADDDPEKPDSVTKPIPPLITIPTTSGTGAEVTSFAVITNTKEKYKMIPGSWRSTPKIALVDPLMTTSMPPQVTATTGMDALSHAIEAYCSPYAMSQTDALALSTIKLVVENLEVAVADGTNLKAREAMSIAAMQGGLCINANLGGVHALGHQLSSQYNIPHGMAMSIMMPVIMEFNIGVCTDRMVDIARALGERTDGLSKTEAALVAPRAVRRLATSLGLPVSLSDCGADPENIPTAAKWALNDFDILGNPRSITIEQAEDLYLKAFEEKPQ
jgi:alcohol dehydrogenase